MIPNPALAAWLDAQRPQLLPAWTPWLTAPRGAAAASPVATAAPPAAHTAALYEALVAAARGESAPLVDELQALVGSAPSTQPDLNAGLALLHGLQRAAWAALRRNNGNALAALELRDALDELFAEAAAALVAAWSQHTAALLSESEFMAQSLDAASAAADKRALQLQSLNVIGRQLSSVLDGAQLVELVINSLQELTGVAHVSLWQPAEIDHAADGDSPLALVAVRALGAEQAPVAGSRLALRPGGDSITRAFTTGVAQLQMRPDPRAEGAWLQPGCGLLALPMVVGARAVAVVLLQDPDPVEQLRFQQDVAQGVIGQAAIALQNAQLYAEVRNLNVELEQRVVARTRELQEEKDRLATIHKVSSEVNSTLDLDSLLQTSLQHLAEITRAEHASIMLTEQPDASLLMTRAVLGVPENQHYIRFPIGVGIAGWVAQQRTGLLIEDVAQDARWVSVPGGSPRRREGAMLAVPLVNQGEVLGVVTLSHSQTGFFHEGHLRMLSACAGAIAIGINNANLFETLMREAERRAELLEQQRTEASKINAILQSLNDGVIVCDLYGGVLAANAAAATMLQRKVEELVVWNLHEILARYLGPRAAELPLELLLKRPTTMDSRPRMFHSQLTLGLRTVSLTMGPVLKDDDELVGALLVLRDISREVESDRLKTEFIGTMSHELRTPMTAIKGFTQLLSMGSLGPLTDTQREFVTTIHANTERMISLINDVLDITKIESGSVELELRPLHLAEALSGVMTELRGLIADRHHELQISIPPGLPLVRADAMRLHQILYNLLSNAAKYTPRGGRIVVEAHAAALAELPAAVRDALDPERRYTQLSVRDSGVGIAPEEQERIFDRFYRTENQLKIEAGGAGLGLSLVKPLLRLLGGQIWVESAVGEGSCFSVVLPAEAR
jgi:signal transduction histidine kinase